MLVKGINTIHKPSRNISGKFHILYYEVLHESLWLPLQPVSLSFLCLLSSSLLSVLPTIWACTGFWTFITHIPCLNITSLIPCGAFHSYSILSKNVPLWKAFPDNLPNVALSLCECRSHLGLAQSHWWNTSLSHFKVSVVMVEIKIYHAVNICGKGSGKHLISKEFVWGSWLLKSEGHSSDYKLFMGITMHLLAAIWQAFSFYWHKVSIWVLLITIIYKHHERHVIGIFLYIIDIKGSFFFKNYLDAREMSVIRDLHKAWRTESTPRNCPLMSACMTWHTPHVNKYNLKLLKKEFLVWPTYSLLWQSQGILTTVSHRLSCNTSILLWMMSSSNLCAIITLFQLKSNTFFQDN